MRRGTWTVPVGRLTGIVWGLVSLFRRKRCQRTLGSHKAVEVPTSVLGLHCLWIEMTFTCCGIWVLRKSLISSNSEGLGAFVQDRSSLLWKHFKQFFLKAQGSKMGRRLDLGGLSIAFFLVALWTESPTHKISKPELGEPKMNLDCIVLSRTS